MGKAAKFAILDAVRNKWISGDTGNRLVSSFSAFLEHIRGYSIRDLNKVQLEHVQSFGKHVAMRCGGTVDNSLTPKSGRNLISNVNRVLEIMRGDRSLHINPRDFILTGSPQRICRETPEAAEIAALERWGAMGEMGERIECVNEICRTLGLRFEEATKINARVALMEGTKNGAITVSYGTKGGQSRVITLLPHFRADAIRVLQVAEIYQGQHHNLIPPELSESQFTNRAYTSVRGISGFRFHNARHEWARQTYYELTGHDAPIRYLGDKDTFIESLAKERGVTIETALALDNAAKKYIAESLGHHRICVTAIYLH